MSNKCVVCGKKGDKHHVIHRAEGGLDSPLNIIYLCPEHHRGPMGPHQNSSVDLEHKLKMQENLENIFSKKYYSAMEIKNISGISHSCMKKFVKTNRLHKEGYDRNDVIFYLMGGNIYRNDHLDEMFLKEIY